jgi:hypothetical protein
MKVLACIMGLVLLCSCGGTAGAVKNVSAATPCTTDFRNDTLGILSDIELNTAWTAAQQNIASGQWVINVTGDPHCGDPNTVCEYEPANEAALTMKPECFGVRGTHGEPTPGEQVTTVDAHNIAVNVDLGHDKAWAYASYGMATALGIRLGFPVDRR